MHRLQRPRNFFLITFGVLLLLILVVDAAHYTEDPLDASTVSIFGSVFLAQSLAILATTIFVAVKQHAPHVLWQWTGALCVTLLLILISFWAFFAGPRIVTESDGPASVRYYCVWSEQYTTVDKFTELVFGLHKDIIAANEPPCVLKNLTLAASNLSPWQGRPYVIGWEIQEVVTFGAYELLVAGGFFGTRKLLSAKSVEKDTQPNLKD